MKRIYTMDQYRRDYERLQTVRPVPQRPTDSGGLKVEEPFTPNKPSGHIDFAAAIACGLGPKPTFHSR